MTHVIAFRSVPAPIIGMVTVINNRLNVLEDSLDWLETTGTLVERFDPADVPSEVARRPVVRELLASTENALPVILVDDVVVLQGEYPSRARLARIVGSALRHGRRTNRPAA